MLDNVPRLLVALVLCLGSAQVSIADRPGASTEIPTGAVCREAPRTSRRVPSVELGWQSPSDEDDRRALAVWCGTVGPAAIEAEPPGLARMAPSPESIVIATWNLHVGGADLPGFIAALRRGEFTDGAAVRDFVLLLQEAHRSGPDVPPLMSARGDVPSRIDPSPPAGLRQDIVSVARDLGLALFYVPSMRNGPENGDRAEDRGNAILSTLPLSDFRAIELPFERQRRVAIAAAVAVSDDRGTSRLLVSSAHLDATAGLRRLRVFASGWRARQARALVDALREETASMVMGSDLNTWWSGADEPAFRALQSLFTATPRSTFAAHSGGLTLDYLFFRLPLNWRSDVRRAEERFGSDHSPLIGRLLLD